MNKIKTTIWLSILAVLLSCSKTGKHAHAQQSIEFKAMISGSAVISDAKYILDGKETSLTGLNGVIWTSGKLYLSTPMHNAAIVVSGPATNGAMLTVQIYIGGQLMKEEISAIESLQGRISATATYSGIF